MSSLTVSNSEEDFHRQAFEGADFFDKEHHSHTLDSHTASVSSTPEKTKLNSCGAAARKKAMQELIRMDSMRAMLWGDPTPLDEPGFMSNTARDTGLMFGPDVTEAFLEKNELEMVIRSHQAFFQGFKYHHNGRVLTVFSASGYMGRSDVSAGLLRLRKAPQFTKSSVSKHLRELSESLRGSLDLKRAEEVLALQKKFSNIIHCGEKVVARFYYERLEAAFKLQASSLVATSYFADLVQWSHDPQQLLSENHPVSIQFPDHQSDSERLSRVLEAIDEATEVATNPQASPNALSSQLQFSGDLHPNGEVVDSHWDESDEDGLVKGVLDSLTSVRDEKLLAGHRRRNGLEKRNGSSGLMVYESIANLAEMHDSELEGLENNAGEGDIELPSLSLKSPLSFRAGLEGKGPKTSPADRYKQVEDDYYDDLDADLYPSGSYLGGHLNMDRLDAGEFNAEVDGTVSRAESPPLVGAQVLKELLKDD